VLGGFAGYVMTTSKMEFNTYDYVEPEFKNVIATGEYAAHYWFEQGWKACRLAFLLHERGQTND
jgi:hypothetical protein